MISLPTSARLYIHHDTLDILLFGIDLKCAVCHSENEIQVMWRPFQYIRPCEVIESIHWMLQFDGGKNEEKLNENEMYKWVNNLAIQHN